MGQLIIPYIEAKKYTYDPLKIEVSAGLVNLREPLICYAHWSLNESSGIIAPDSSGNGRDGTLKNMEDADWVPGKLNNCLLFDGVNEYIDCGTIANFERDTSFSYECWFKTTSSGLVMLMAKMGINIKGPLLYSFSGKIYWALYTTSSVYASIHTINTYNDNSWHHLVATYNGLSLASGLNIYIDGTLSSTVIDRDNLNNTILNDSNFRVGARVLSPAGYFSGKIDELVIYDREVTAADVTQRWNNGQGVEKGLYPTTKPTISNICGAVDSNLNEWTGFEELLSPENEGQVRYQLSDNDLTWKYWNGIEWIVAGTYDYNDVETVNTHIPSFSTTSKYIYIKVFLISNGLQKVELDKLTINYSTLFPPSLVLTEPLACTVVDKTSLKATLQDKEYLTCNIV